MIQSSLSELLVSFISCCLRAKSNYLLCVVLDLYQDHCWCIKLPCKASIVVFSCKRASFILRTVTVSSNVTVLYSTSLESRIVVYPFVNLVACLCNVWYIVWNVGTVNVTRTINISFNMVTPRNLKLLLWQFTTVSTCCLPITAKRIKWVVLWASA